MALAAAVGFPRATRALGGELARAVSFRRRLPDLYVGPGRIYLLMPGERFRSVLVDGGELRQAPRAPGDPTPEIGTLTVRGEGSIVELTGDVLLETLELLQGEITFEAPER